MHPVAIIGMGLTPDDLSRKQRALIDAADVLVGGRRHLAHFAHHRGDRHTITGNLQETVRFIDKHKDTGRVVVLASGDPLFFGIGSYLARQLGADCVEIHPNVSSVAAAFARLKMPWHDARVVSLHGRRSTATLWPLLAGENKIALLTDTDHSPAWLAGALLEKGIHDFSLWVLERLGSTEERVARHDLQTAAAAAFADPNLAVLVRNPASSARRVTIGLPDDDFDHRRGLITKSEVRAVALAKLQLQPDHVLWDLGAGSGAVAVEAGALVRQGQIIAVEQHRDHIEQIEANRRRFGIANLQVVRAVLPDKLFDLPRPDRVFIGGGGRALPAIITAVGQRLNSGGVVVANTVILANAVAAQSSLAALGMVVETVQVQVNRTREMPGGERLQAENPVYIVTAKKMAPSDGAPEGTP